MLAITLPFVTNMLNYLLTASPGRLRVVRLRPRVFQFSVSCLNIANVLVVWGMLSLVSSVLHLHASIAAAAQAAKQVGADRVAPDEGLDLNSQQPGKSVVNDTMRNSSFLRPVAQGSAVLTPVPLHWPCLVFPPF